MRLGFLILIGIPGCGKTTLAKYMINNFKHYNGITYNFIHVCYDELIHFPNENHNFEWKSARDLVSVEVENVVKAIKNKNVDLCPSEFLNQLQSVQCWESDFVLVLDDNMYFKSMRYSLFQLAKKHKLSFCQVYLKCSLENALLKNSLRESNSIVPPHVIKNMYTKIEPPDCKNNWEKYSIECNAFCNLNKISNKLFSILNDSLNNFFYDKDNVEMIELSQRQCKRSVIHQADIALRKIIGCRIKKFLSVNTESECKGYISDLNLRKCKILLDIKVGNICVPEEILEDMNSEDKFQFMQFLDGYLKLNKLPQKRHEFSEYIKKYELIDI